ncbi:cytochrome P450 [Streptomyces sp. SYSU K217416]
MTPAPLRQTRPIPQAPGAVPFLGHAHRMRACARLKFLESLRTGDPLATFRIGARRIYAVHEPDLIKDVFVQHAADLGTSNEYSALTAVAGNGLLLAEGPLHRSRRRLVLPTFDHAHMRRHAEIMSALADARIRAWPENRPIDVTYHLGFLATEIAVRCLFSQHISTADMGEVVAGMETLMDWVGRIGLGPMGTAAARLPTPLNRRFRRSLGALHGIVGRSIDDRLGCAQPVEDLLAVLLAARDPATGLLPGDQQVRNEVLAFMMASADATTHTLAWTLYLLGRHPAVLTRLRQETDTALGDRAATADDLPKLPYTRHVLAETLRLYPPGYLLSRRTKTEIRTGGYTLPTGVTVAYSPWAQHRDPKLFPDPLTFAPDRWSGHCLPAMVRDAYLPFGTGPHRCIGEAFALTKLTIVLATFISRYCFHLHSRDDVRPRPQFTLACGPIPVTVHRRGRSETR